jgi:hypothetical protein
LTPWLIALVVVAHLFLWSLCRAAALDEQDREALEKQRREMREAERIVGTLERGE